MELSRFLPRIPSVSDTFLAGVLTLTGCDKIPEATLLPKCEETEREREGKVELQIIDTKGERMQIGALLVGRGHVERMPENSTHPFQFDQSQLDDGQLGITFEKYCPDETYHIDVMAGDCKVPVDFKVPSDPKVLTIKVDCSYPG